MMVRRIIVEPSGDAWAVREIGQADAVTCHSGAQAERVARALGERFAQEGAFAHVKVVLRNGAVGGRYLYVPKGDDPSRGASQGPLALAA
jgi:hypothetical protein